ncbi:GHMP family kinase ATP-binding protein [Rothia aerolata]|uniref:4-diphosphocytidyl-2-C-methyl-D-erythritol kinase n=1 Tax=Rothia aerolata TaxID=1812262 RepID=A0A917MTJ2_9MICC|nr:4-diphosphocytidyl-2C-methyl-D-erythritol kinase [Rothia aerolata]GGH62903.1 4-diphosphocytidyl-2-C-methyl-D-erythritol kinase [Rothia aerolata]
MTRSVSRTAPGKVNLYFAVGPLRADGYHEVASLYAATDILERVTVSAGEQPGITQSMSVAPGSPVDQQVVAGAFDPALVPLDESNLAYRGAAAVLGEKDLSTTDIAVNLHIEKAVPVAGGMGGGSADAAAAMKAMNAYLVEAGLATSELPLERLLELAAPLGADVPFALLGGLAVGAGVGEKLTPMEIPEGVEPLRFGFVPSTSGLSTPAVFRELDDGRAAGRYPAPDAALEVPRDLIEALTTEAPLANRLPKIAALLRNDLAAPAVTLLPELELTLGSEAAKPQVAASFVSGSGPTVIKILF